MKFSVFEAESKLSLLYSNFGFSPGEKTVYTTLMFKKMI